MRATRITGESGAEHLVALPVGCGLDGLAFPLRAYFPDGNIDQWMDRSERWRKGAVKLMWEPYCALSGCAGVEVHEITPQGMGERRCTLVPWNMIVLSTWWHRECQLYRALIHEYDPLARVLSVGWNGKIGHRYPPERTAQMLYPWMTKRELEREKTKGVVLG